MGRKQGYKIAPSGSGLIPKGYRLLEALSLSEVFSAELLSLYGSTLYFTDLRKPILIKFLSDSKLGRVSLTNFRTA